MSRRPATSCPDRFCWALLRRPRTTWGVDNAPVPSKISIFRGPHERLFRTPEARRRAVEETVFHETAHHFGISDDRLRELQASRARPNRR